MSTETKTIWTRVDGKRPRREAVLVGRQISRDWLSGSVSLTQVRLAGEMKQAFSDLVAAAKDAKLNLPIVSLRTALICRMDNVVTLDKDLGLVAGKLGGFPCAAEIYSPADDELPIVRDTLVKVIKGWIMDDVEMWAERRGMGHLVSRLKETVSPAAIDLAAIQVPYVCDNGQPNYPLIARSIGERLVGEELFEGLGNCELVASPEYRGNSVELMTLPRRGATREEVYSMVARLTVASIPYSKNDVFLSVSAMKRVWAKKPPTVLFGPASSVSGYVVAVGRPVAKVGVVRADSSWEFGEEYSALRRESEDKLPPSLAEAIGQREFNTETGWWAGLPELPALYRSVSPRTVFESDEISLLETVSQLLEPLVSNKSIPIREIKLPRFQAKPRQEMLKLSDFGVAGAVFNVDEAAEDDEDETLDHDTGTREEKLLRYREQNTEALKRVHGDKMPMIWMLGGSPVEQELTRRTISILFGDTITVNTEVLPDKTHGLREDLDHPAFKARKRFDERVKRWQSAAETIKEVSGDRHIVVLICAPDRVGKKPEDAVNYYAGIHAMSTIGANIHHVLPIEAPDDPKSHQNFLHRVQSALLDVMLAHTGAVFGVKAFVERLLPQQHIPEAIYGVQAVRSRAQSRSGQTGVNFVLYSRLIVESGKTEVCVGYRAGNHNQITGWMALSHGLAWMGSQRRLQDGDANWLKTAFADLTRKVLADISELDPKAVVLIEWDSVRSLWKGISDVDLDAGNPPRLEATNLSQLKNMAFVRLRRGIDTLGLRTMVNTTFKGWKESDGVRSDTGEIKPDTYVTTNMRLVEVAEESLPQDRGFGHYIASMGYPKTVQIKRGLSCYRTIPRMVRMGDGLAEFEQKTMDVASMDASLPAPMDISVMSSPDGVAPKQYAILAMGLRLGYAHYNDWTKWPMPLFFRRKIEDYVIRYPEEADEGAIVEAVAGEVAEEAVRPTLYSSLVVQEAEGIQEEAPPEDQTTPDVLGTPSADAGDDLLSRVKRTPMPFIMKHQDHHTRQIVQRMLNGGAHVDVELPYWVKTRGIFSLTEPVTKRRVQRSWDWMKDFGYVKSGISRPGVDDYMDWLAEKLLTPQVCSTIVSAARALGQITFAQMAEIIEREFNSSVPEEEKVTPYAIDDNMLERLAKWADAHQHDELMGWLVFMVSQLPNRDGAERLTKHIHAIPGPRTAHALEYYLATASAINAVLEQKHNRGYFTIQRSLPKPQGIELSAAVGPKSKQSGTQTTPAPIEEAPVMPPIAAVEKKQGEDLVMTTKSTLIQLVEAIEPGAVTFDATLAQIQEQIGALSEIHAERKVLHAAAAAMTEKMHRFIEQQKTVAGSINAMHEILEIGRVEARSVRQDDLEAAMDELIKIEEAISNLAALLKQLDELEHSPRPTGLQERKKRQKVEQQITDSAESRTEGVRNLIESGLCFTLEGPGTAPPEEAEILEQPAAEIFEAAPPDTTTIAPGNVAVTGEVVPAGPTPVLEPEARAVSEAVAAPVSEAVAAPVSVITVAEITLPEPPVKPPELIKLAEQRTAQPTKLPPSPVPAAAPEASSFEIVDGANSGEENGTSLGAAALESKIGPLRTLVQRRLYGLADVHVAAIGSMLDGTNDQELQVHHAILAALVRSLDLMDCHFAFDMKLDSKLREFLVAEKLPSGEMSHPAHMALGILAAGLGNLLFDDPEVQWQIVNAVSSCLADYPALSSLVKHLELIRQRGFVLTRDLFVRSRIGDKNAQALELARFQKRAANWKQEPDIHATFNHRGFKAMHEEMFSPSNPIGKCLFLIAKGDAAKVASAYEEGKRKFEKAAQTVDELYKKIGEKTKPDGLYRIQAVENIATTQKFVDSYLDLVRRHTSQDAELSRDIQSFLDGLNHRLTDAIKECQGFETVSNLEALYRDTAVKAFECAIQLFDTQEPQACIPNNKQKLLIQWPIGKDLMPAMNKPDRHTAPLCTPDDVLEQTRRLAEENLTLDDPSSDDDIDRALADAYQGHLAEKRFLPAFMIEELHGKPLVTKGPTLAQQYARERDALIAELQDARQKVTHAMTLDALPEEEETYRMQRVIEELLMLCRGEQSIGMPGVESVAYPDFPQARAALRSNVLQPLESRLSNAKAKLEIDLEDDERKGLLPVADIARIKQMLASNNAASLRTAHDALAMLRQSGKLPARISDTGNRADEYDAFMETLRKSTGRSKRLLEGLKEILTAKASDGDEPAWLAKLDQEQRAESVELIDAWVDFFITRNPSKTEATERLFRAMSIPVTPSHYPEPTRRNRARFMVDDTTFLFPTTGDDEMFIPPVLGSRATHTQCYALFGATQENEIRQLMLEIGSVPTLVFARTHLNMQKRAKVSGSAPILLVDDDLLAYIALHPGERLQALIKVGMLTFSTNPYDDYGSKPVPTEMFFGRQEELERLRNVKGLAVLYGGRRLGKSSLLSQIEWESRNTPGKETVYVSMETINTADHVLSAWEFIYRALINRRIIQPLHPLPNLWKSLSEHISKGLIENPSLKSLYLLIDEANDLMGCELRVNRSDIGFVRGLTQLADDVAHKCQVRMVIAGLHNMTRMANDENSVFGKAETIPLKPFSTSDDVQRGIRLITKPLAAMGYFFGPGSEDLPLRILSVCNFYPAFIQLYCKRLVERLQNNRQDKKPPIEITEDDLKAVEKDNNLLTELRDKFKLNLNLDKRYKAIALILADVYYTESETGEYKGLTTAEVREHCEVYCGRHFENTGPGVYEALLDEMGKLNVIGRVGTRYVLRNPSIAMMVGDRDRVTTLIGELANEPPETSRNQGERRIPMTRNSAHMVFPMPMSWIRNHMDASDGELLILTGNALSGIMDLARLDREEWRLQDGVFMSAPVNSPQNLSDLVTKIRRVAQDHRAPKILSVRHAAWRVEQIPEYAAIANKAGRFGIRIVLLAHPERALEIATALESGALKPGDDGQRGWRVVPIPTWTHDAIYYRVHENIRVAESQEAIAAIRTATGGFGKEVVALCTDSLTLETALAAPDTVRKTLAPNLESFYQHIGMPPYLISERGDAIKDFLNMTNGSDRSNFPELEEYKQEYGISEELFQFLYWMGLVQEGPEHTWTVPKMYADLIN